MGKETNQQILEESFAAREKMWQSVGTVHPDLLSFLINPSFMGAPAWPAMRQSFRRIQREETTIIASDGLSDPFDDETPPTINGLRLEVFIEAETQEGMERGWPFQLVYQVAQLAAGRGDLVDLINEYGVISTELYDVTGLPPHYLNEAGGVGVLIGVPAPGIPESVALPLSNIRLISATLLTPEELHSIVVEGPEAREALVQKFRKQGTHHISRITTQ